MIKRSLALLCMLGSVQHIPATAETLAGSGYNYHSEMSAGYTSSGHGSFAEHDLYSASYTHYFGELSEFDHPPAERNFVNQRNYLGLGYQHRQTEEKSFFGIAALGSPVFAGDIAEVDSFGNTWRLHGRYHLDAYGLFVGGGIERENRSGPDPINFTQQGQGISTTFDRDEIDEYSVHLGAYLLPTAQLRLAYSTAEAKVRQQQVVTLPFPNQTISSSSSSVTEQEEWTLSLRHLGTIATMSYSALLTYSRESTDFKTTFTDSTGLQQSFSFDGNDIDTYQLGGGLYLSPEFRLSLSWSRADADRFDTDTYSLGAQWFANERFAVSAHYARDDFPFGHQTEQYSLAITFRL